MDVTSHGIKLGAAIALAGALFAGGALAQSADSETELRRLQAEQFQEMFADPDNLDLMFQYALTSIRLKDYEAAISTLDRMLIFNANLPRVRVELAASYFRIGSYPIARVYFEQVQEDPSAPEDLKARAGEFLAEIDKRTRESYFTGVVGASVIFTDNANNGPDNREIDFLGVTATLTGEEVTAQTDIGAALTAQIAHIYDLGGASGDIWRSDLAIYSQRFASTEDGAADVIVARTGPRLSLDDDRYGVKGRPFVEFDHVRSSNDSLYTTIGAGIELTNTIDSEMSVFGEMRIGYRDFHNNTALSDKDQINLRASAGANFFVDDATTLRARALFEFEGADSASERSYEVGLEGGAFYRYDSGFEDAARRWLLAGTIRGLYRKFDAPGTGQASLTETRDDFDLRIALSHTAYLMDGLALVARAEYFLRESNIRNFDVDSITVSAGVEYAF